MLHAAPARAQEPASPSATPPAEPAARSAQPAAKPEVKATARAQAQRVDRTEYEVRRPHTMAEIELGVLALPNAPISAGRRGGDTPLGKIGNGDATLMLGVNLLYRGDPRWAVGASAMFGPSPTSDPRYGGRDGLDRSHERSYFWIGAQARYYPIRVRPFEAFVGVQIGGVVVGDRYTNNSGEGAPTYYGYKTMTVRSEGFSFGASLGARFNFARSWSLGASLRADQWFLPTHERCTPVGDCATLAGAVFAMGGGVTIGYRIAL